MGGRSRSPARAPDLSAATRTLLTQARQTIWQVISNGRDMRTSEMWTWSYVNGKYQTDAFGTRSADATEANAAALEYDVSRDPRSAAARGQVLVAGVAADADAQPKQNAAALAAR